MHWFDISVIVLLVLSTLYSLIRGLIKEVFSLGALIIAFILAHRYYSLISIRISGFIPNDVIADLLSFGFIFIFSALIINQIGNLTRKLLHSAKTLSFMDRLAGSFIGLIKGLLIVAVIMIPISIIPYAKKEMLSDSKLVPLFLKYSRMLSKISLSDPNILENWKYKMKLFEMKEKLKLGIDALKGSLEYKGGKKGKDKNSIFDNITEEDKKKLKELIDKNL